MKGIKSIHPALLLLIVCLVVYSPILLNLYAIKFDVLVHFYPIRYHIGLALQQGEFPFWCPYFSLGYPIHGDMQSGVWNPLVLLLGKLTGYRNMIPLNIETLIYIYLSGLGMHFLLLKDQIKSDHNLFISIAYMCSGFTVSSITHMTWMSGLAYFPFVFLFLKNLLAKQSIKNIILFTVFSSLFFLSSYPGFIIIAFYFFLIYTVYQFTKKPFLESKKIMVALIISAIPFFLICLPAILSYIDFMPYYSRGGNQSLEYCNRYFWDIRSISSLLFPFGINRIFKSDLMHQSVYIGIIPFFLFIKNIDVQFFKKNLLLFMSLLILFLASLGPNGLVRSILYYCLALMKTFQNPALFRYFWVFIFLVLIAKLIREKNIVLQLTKTNLITLVLFFLLTSLVSSFYLSPVLTSLLINFSKSSIILFLKNPAYSDQVFIQSIIFVLLFLFGLLLTVTKKLHPKTILFLLLFLELFVHIQSLLPITVFSKTPGKHMNARIEKFPFQFTIPTLKPIAIDENNEFPKEYLFNKIITLDNNLSYIGIMKNYNIWFANKNAVDSVCQKPFIYLENNDPLEITKFTSNSIKLNCNSTQIQSLFLTQNFNHNWQALVNGKNTQINKANYAFMKITVPKNINKLEFKYSPKRTIYAMYISVLTLLFLLLIYFLPKNRLKSAP